MKGTKILRISIYVIAIFVVTILAAEMTLRILGYRHSSPNIMYDKYCYWRMAPNQKIHYKDAYGDDIYFSINSLGARGKEFPIKKPLGEKRIICVGDSYTYGWGVDDAQTYPARLQNLINKDFENIKVINYGCNGHTILHEADLIKKYGPKLSPDYVIVATSINTDFYDIDELDFNLGCMPAPGYNLIKRSVLTTAIGNILLKYWNSDKVKKIISHRKAMQSSSNKNNRGGIREWSKEAIAAIAISDVFAHDNEKKKAFEIYIDKLDELVKMADENKFKLIYVIVPFGVNGLDKAMIHSMYRKDGAMPARQYFEFLKNRYGDKITLIELMSSFPFKDLFLPDSHLNAKGNRLAAEVIYKQIKTVLEN